MSKLPRANTFLDLSDYGRPIARRIANGLKNTQVTPVQVTLWFIIAGLLGILSIFYNYLWLAGFLLITKSILDAADGELARVKKTPSYTGRFLDSIADFILNFILFAMIWWVTDIHWIWGLLSFFGLQLQGTLYNYYYVIVRNTNQGDTTSRIIEKGIPVALPGERQEVVTFLFRLYTAFYGVFDRIIYWADPNAIHQRHFPKWFMTVMSTFGLGFQLLLISILLALGLKEVIIPFFLAYTAMIAVFIAIRHTL